VKREGRKIPAGFVEASITKRFDGPVPADSRSSLSTAARALFGISCMYLAKAAGHTF
jgi:hypothetical protein